jgi:hypothetical protein
MDRYIMKQTQTTYKVNDLITSISFGEGKTFKEQLLNDESFKILSGLYGKYPQLREHIEAKLEWLFHGYDKQYFETALATVKVGGLILDILYNEKVTIQ